MYDLIFFLIILQNFVLIYYILKQKHKVIRRRFNNFETLP